MVTERKMQIHSLWIRAGLIPVFGMLVLLSGCKGRSGSGSVPSGLPAGWSVVSEAPEYSPRATFTSLDYIDSLIPAESEGNVPGLVNARFVEGCYYTGERSTPLLASFAERWNRMAFLRRFANAEELFERLNTDYADTLSTATVHGDMPMTGGEYELAFGSRAAQSRAKELVRMLTTMDCTPAETERLADRFMALASLPYEMPDLLSAKEVAAVLERFPSLYDKSAVVDGYDAILKKRIAKDVDYDELKQFGDSLRQRYVAVENFDARCIYALEMGCCGLPEAVDYLGELMEDGRYSKYLCEVWFSWRLLVQSISFGVSTWSEIPDNLYDRVRLLVAETYLRHLEEEPSDALARALLTELTFTENLHRAAGIYGNEALGAERILRRNTFYLNTQ